MKFQFDNNVEIVFSPYSDNYGMSWEESCVCYPVLGDWELVINFAVDEKKPVEQWTIDYIGTVHVEDGTNVVNELSSGSGATLAMLPDRGLYVKRVWEHMQLVEKANNAGEAVHELGAWINTLKVERSDAPESAMYILNGKIADNERELAAAEAEMKAANAALNESVGKDPTFEQVD